MKRLLITFSMLLTMALFWACEKDEGEILEPLTAEAKVINVSKFDGNDGAIDLTIKGGTVPYSINWANNSTSEDLQSLKAGDYKVTITDAKGNTISQTVTITQPTASQIELTCTKKDVSGYGQSDGSIDLTVKGAISPLKIEWNNGQIIEDIEKLKAGDYTVTVTDNNNSSAILKITISQPNPDPISITYVIKQEISYYGGGDGAIDITVTGGILPYIIKWSDDRVREDRTSMKAGNYEVTVTDSIGNTASLKIELSQPKKLFETIEFPSLDGITITADLYHLSDDAPVIVLCHQAGYSRGEYRYTATIFNSLGFNCLAIDQRSGDICNGVDNETNKKAKEKGLKTDYWDAEPDVAAAVKYMADKYKKHIVLLGSSYSTAISIKLAPESDLIDVVLTFSPYVDPKVMTAAKTLNKPIFLTCPKNEISEVQQVYDAIVSNDKVFFKPAKSTIHGASMLSTPSTRDEVWPEVKDFLSKYVKGLKL